MSYAVLAVTTLCLVMTEPVALDETGNVCAGPSMSAEVPAAPFSPVLEWTAKAPMPTARYGFGVAVLADSLYAVGGYGDSGRLALNEVYCPLTNTWANRAPMPTKRNGCCAATAAGKVYAIAGYNGSYLDVVEEYSPATNTWTVKSPLAVGRTTPVAVAAGGKIYVMGGFNGSAYPRTVERFDPGTGIWDTVAPMPTGRTAPAATVHDKKIYVIGGWTGGEPPLAVVEIYDPGTNTWTSGTAAPTRRWFMAATAMDSWVFACGGAASFTGSYLNLVEAYNPVTGQWSAPAPLPVNAKGPAAGTVLDKAYVVGGFNGVYLADNNEGRLVTTALAEGRAPEAGLRLGIGPNPCSGIARLHSAAPLGRVSVFDLEGRAVARLDCAGQNRAELDLTRHPDGVYFVVASAGQASSTARLVLSH